MPHHAHPLDGPLQHNSFNTVVGVIGQITENSVSDLTLLGEKDLGN